ncbi:MAG: sensor histidine kinase [Chloroflexi bacterium]|nr:sensor histidine kinase [Chloroflexota bacterium]
MDRSTARSTADPRGDPFDSLHAEAKAALSQAANSVRSIRDRYREAYHGELARWHAVHDEVDPGGSPPGPDRSMVTELGEALGVHERELSRLDLAQRSLESSWLFLEHGDVTLISDPASVSLPTDLQMRILEAQEAERGRLAQDVHDGPAQALTNAIFQVEYIERVLHEDPALVRTEIGILRAQLRRELDEVRTFITHLRPPLLDQLGLDGAIAEAAATLAAVAGMRVDTALGAPADHLAETEQTVALRIVQEALQNVRKHAAADGVTVSSRMAGPDWILEVRDDGRGFDVGTVAARGRRNFGLQFMRERAELIGARFDVRSSPAEGTTVTLTIPTGEENR